MRQADTMMKKRYLKSLVEKFLNFCLQETPLVIAIVCLGFIIVYGYFNRS